MVRHKSCKNPVKSPVKSTDIAKCKFKPGKFVIIRTVKTDTPKQIPANIEMASTSNDVAQSPAATNTDTGILSTLRINVPTNNKFQVLENENLMEVTSQNNDPTPTKEVNNKQRSSKPPPIVLHYKVLEHSKFIQKLEEEVRNGFYIKNTKNNTNLFIKDPEEYKKYLLSLENQKISFHTYSEKTNKTHAFVLKGIDSDPTVEEIKMNLEEKYPMKVKNVFKMKNTTRNNYLVITDNTIFLKFLNANVKYVCYTKVIWERHRNRSLVLQCRRCQQWGHATSNCRANPVCTKCGGKHWTKECETVSKTDEKTHQYVKCANCGGNHVAFSKTCPEYQKRIEAIERRKLSNGSATNRKSAFIPAPMPKTNPWNGNHPDMRRETAPGSFITNNYVSTGNQSKHNDRMNETTDTPNNFSALAREMTELNQLIDLGKMVRLVRQLNSELRGCSNEIDKFIKFNQFCQNNFKAIETAANSWHP